MLKHLAGNMRSRWREFLTIDGVKPSQEQDGEFEADPGDTPEAIRARWDEVWGLLFSAIEPLAKGDLTRTVTIRGEPHSVLPAVNRQQTHHAFHVGQIVFLARHFAGSDWRSLGIPKGKSREYEESVHGKTIRPPAGR